jgi:hypothetical protein
MTAITLRRVALLLQGRLTALEERLQGGDEMAWGEFVSVVTAYAAVAAQLLPERYGELLSTRAMAEKLNVSPRTLLKRKSKGAVTPAVQLGKRGRAAIRWRGDEVAR